MTEDGGPRPTWDAVAGGHPRGPKESIPPSEHRYQPDTPSPS